MKRFEYRFCLAVSLVLLSIQCLAQDKVEREYKIKFEEVPQRAQDFVYKTDILLPKTKVNWYREVSATDETIEAKFQQKGRRYSVEFSKEGELEDAEIEILFEEVESATREVIEQKLDSAFVKWKVKKIQKQWVGEEKNVSEALKTLERGEGVEENYELVIKGESERKKSYFEVLFDEDGNLLRKSRIVQNSVDILVY